MPLRQAQGRLRRAFDKSVLSRLEGLNQSFLKDQEQPCRVWHPPRCPELEVLVTVIKSIKKVL